MKIGGRPFFSVGRLYFIVIYLDDPLTVLVVASAHKGRENESPQADFAGRKINLVSMDFHLPKKLNSLHFLDMIILRCE